ncbi:hypothetical protein TNCV_164191 [Trichonephila clavipes]|nr:hypothetical protein TNCV_164191 [Trichonephila clavipes]
MYLQHKILVCYLHKFPQQRRATIQSSSGHIDDYIGKIPYRSAGSVGEMTSGPPDHLPIHQCPLKKSSVRTVSRPFKGSFRDLGHQITSGQFYYAFSPQREVAADKGAICRKA